MAESRHSDRGFVVVTGTSMGIGAATVALLARLGCRVFAEVGGSSAAAASSVGKRGDR
jgi:NAD(P)-dependent dehydrogenase (short-subunit alcohol dehydrogenase family)